MNQAQKKLFIDRLCSQYDLVPEDFHIIDGDIFIKYQAVEKMFYKMNNIILPKK